MSHHGPRGLIRRGHSGTLRSAGQGCWAGLLVSLLGSLLTQPSTLGAVSVSPLHLKRLRPSEVKDFARFKVRLSASGASPSPAPHTGPCSAEPFGFSRQEVIFKRVRRFRGASGGHKPCQGGRYQQAPRYLGQNCTNAQEGSPPGHGQGKRIVPSRMRNRPPSYLKGKVSFSIISPKPTCLSPSALRPRF